MQKRRHARKDRAASSDRRRPGPPDVAEPYENQSRTSATFQWLEYPKWMGGEIVAAAPLAHIKAEPGHDAIQDESCLSVGMRGYGEREQSRPAVR
jgi:hypothetical protein